MGFSAVSPTLTRLAVCFTALQVAIVCGQLSVSPSGNTTVFLGGEFDRLCTHSTGATLEWIRNETVVLGSPPAATRLPLSLVNVEFGHAGQYSCRARLSGGRTDGPVNAGYLRVLDPDRIVAPPIQYAFQGNSAILNCTTDLPNAFVRWYRGEVVDNAAEVQRVISNITVRDEGTYTCRVFLFDVDLSHTKTFQLRVIIPPVILAHPPPHTELIGTPTTFNLTVQFQSRFLENTTVTWRRNNSLLPDDFFQTSYTNEINAVTVVNFPTVSRSDAGLYQVTIKNLEVVSTSLMTTSGVYQLIVVVPPALPSNVRVSDTTSSQVQVTWSLTHQHADERAESLTLTVQFSNGTIAQQYQLEGNATQHMVDTVPGMEYLVTVSASNQDGTRTTDPVSFQTAPGQPSISSVEVTRLNRTTFNLSVSLAYTGGGAITHFRVSFRDIGSTPWTSLGDIPATPSPDSSLLWSGVVSRDEFATYSQVEFMLSITNQHGFESNSLENTEELDLPGAPTLSLLSSTSSSLTIKAELSPEGTRPFLQVVLQITSPQEEARTLNSTHVDANNQVQFQVTSLSADTSYTFIAYTVNHAGNGPPSVPETYRTDAIPQSLPTWAVITVAVGGSVATVIVVILTVAIFCYCRGKFQNGDKFYAGPQITADEKKLDSNHEMVKRQPNSLQDLRFGNGPFTPRSPCYTVASSLPRSSPIPGSAKFDYNSTINGSEGSEIGYPHYTLPAEPMPLSLPNTRGSSLSRDILSPFSPPPSTTSCSTNV